MEVNLGFFTQYRYIPQCSIRRDKATPIPRLLEKHLHEILDEWKYTFDKKFGGSSEFFINLNEEVLLDYLDSFKYTDLLVGKVEMKTDDYEAIKQAIKLDKKDTPELLTIDEDKLPF